MGRVDGARRGTQDLYEGQTQEVSREPSPGRQQLPRARMTPLYQLTALLASLAVLFFQIAPSASAIIRADLQGVDMPILEAAIEALLMPSLNDGIGSRHLFLRQTCSAGYTLCTGVGGTGCCRTGTYCSVYNGKLGCCPNGQICSAPTATTTARPTTTTARPTTTTAKPPTTTTRPPTTTAKPPTTTTRPPTTTTKPPTTTTRPPTTTTKPPTTTTRPPTTTTRPTTITTSRTTSTTSRTTSTTRKTTSTTRKTTSTTRQTTSTKTATTTIKTTIPTVITYTTTIQGQVDAPAAVVTTAETSFVEVTLTAPPITTTVLVTTTGSDGETMTTAVATTLLEEIEEPEPSGSSDNQFDDPFASLHGSGNVLHTPTIPFILLVSFFWLLVAL
ncbi:hypothetical protein BD779DRAFT_1002354 [Infundibulicybe gibba]|nr:hypothetical protein BD779DRAFT_1002354 [Infundibulicybe gibba]